MNSRNRDFRSNAIREYILYKAKDLKKHNVYLTEEQIEKAVEKYNELPWNMRDIEKQIDKDVDELLEQQKLQRDLRDAVLDKIEANKELENEEIPLEYIDENMDKETKDIMNVKDVENIDDLKYEIKEATDIEPSLADPALTDKQMLTAKSEIYRIYQDTETDKKEYQKDSSTMIQKKVDYLKDRGEITEEDEEKLDDIVEESKTTTEMIRKVGNRFEESEAHDIYDTINQDTPLNESGIEKTENNPNINPFDENQQNDELNAMFAEEKTNEEEYTQSPESKEKPKVFVKTEIPNNGNESGYAAIISIGISIIFIMSLIIGAIIRIAS